MSHDHNHDHNSSHKHPHEHDHSHEHDHPHEHGHTHEHEHLHGHDHSHPHEHGREHDPGHGHAHTGEPGREDAQEMSIEDKLAVLLSHWVDHNDSHKDNFFSWAQKAQASGLKEIAAQLEQAGVLSEKVTLALKQAQKVLNG